MTAETSRYVLIVEDDGLQAWDLARTVAKAGFEAVGPYKDCRSALALLEDFVPDAALLDIRLGGGETVKPVADALCGLGVPFAFVTAYPSDRMLILGEHVTAPVYAKPCKPADIARLAAQLTGSGLPV